MKKKLLWNALILTATSLLLRTIGLSFRVYLSNKIGPEGMGLYQLIFSVYMLAATFATSGISTAVTRLAAEENHRGPQNVHYIMKRAFTFSIFLSLTAALILFVFADAIGHLWLHDGRTVGALKILSFSLPFVSLSSCLRGYFFALRKAGIPASAQVLEQLVKIFLIINIWNYLQPQELETACMAIVAGNVIGEALSCIYVLIFYGLQSRKNRPRTVVQVSKGLLRRLLHIALPVAASSYLRSSLKTLENVMIPLALEKSGTSNQNSLKEYGMLKGMVMPILTFPSAFLTAFSTLLVPEISEANALQHQKQVNYTISRVFQLTALFSILVTGIFMMFSEALGLVIYKNQEIGKTLRLLAPLVPLLYFDRVVDGILKGLNQQVSSLKYNIIDSLTRIGMIYYLIPIKGFEGFVLVVFISNILNSFLSIGRLLRVTNLKLRAFRWFVLPIFCVTAAGIATAMLLQTLHLPELSAGMTLSLEIAVVSLLYLLFLRLLRCISREDIRWFKGILR